MSFLCHFSVVSLWALFTFKSRISHTSVDAKPIENMLDVREQSCSTCTPPYCEFSHLNKVQKKVRAPSYTTQAMWAQSCRKEVEIARNFKDDWGFMVDPNPVRFLTSCSPESSHQS